MVTRKLFIGSFVLAFCALGVTRGEAAPAARLKADFGKLSARASEKITLTVDRNTIEWAAKAIAAQGGDAAELRELMKELDGIYVSVLEFGKEKALTPEEITEVTSGILAQLDAAPWASIVSVDGKDKNGVEIVRVSLFNDGTGSPGGLAVLVAEDDELVLVNLVGRVSLDQLSRVGAAFGQPDLFGGMLPGTKATKKGKEPETGKKAGAPAPQQKASPDTSKKTE